jgi:hypothetical protein
MTRNLFHLLSDNSFIKNICTFQESEEKVLTIFSEIGSLCNWGTLSPSMAEFVKIVG